MKRTLLAAAALTIILASACATFRGSPETAGESIVAEASTPFLNENAAAAHDIVIAQARTAALAQVLPAFVPPEDTPEGASFKAKVMAAPAQFIAKEKILRERADRKTYRLKLRTVIPLENLDRAYHDMFPPVHHGKTSVAVVSYEKLNDGKTAAPYGRQAAAKQLRSLPCTVTETDMTAPQDDQSAKQAALAAAANSGAAFAALVTAQASRVDMPQLSLELTAVKATARIQFFSTATGILLAESSKDATSVERSEQLAAQKSLIAAADKAAAEIQPMATRAVKEKFKQITLRVTDLASYDQLRKLRDSLANTNNISDFRLTSFSGGKATYSIESDGIAGEELAATILRQKQVPLIVSYQTEFEVEFKAN